MPRLLPRYDVRIEEYLILTDEDHRLHRVRPDLTVSATPVWKAEGGGPTFQFQEKQDTPIPTSRWTSKRCFAQRTNPRSTIAVCAMTSRSIRRSLPPMQLGSARPWQNCGRRRRWSIAAAAVV